LDNLTNNLTLLINKGKKYTENNKKLDPKITKVQKTITGNVAKST